MSEVTLEEFGGGEAAKPVQKEVSLSSFGANQDLSNEEFTESPAAAAAGVAFDKTVSGLKAVGGEAAALADLVLSMPGFLVGVGAQLGGTVQAKARGVPFTADPRMLNPTTAYGVGREAGREASEPLMNPLKKAMDMFRSGEAYEQAKTTKGMEKVATALEEAGMWAEQTTGGRVSRDSVPMLAETLMAGATGIGSGKGKPAIPAENMKLMREQIKKMREQQELETATQALTPEEFVARVPVQRQINEMLGIRSPAERAKMNRERQRDVRQAFRSPEEGSDYGSIEESQFRAEERLSNEQTFGQAQALDILQRRPEERTAQDIAMLRLGEAANQAQRERAADKTQRAEILGERISMEEAMEIGQKPQEERTNVENTKLRQWANQKGSVSMDALALLSAAGIGTTVGLLDDGKIKDAVLGGMAGLGAGMLMTGPGKVTSRFKQSGAVKGPGGMWHPEAVGRLEEPLNRALVRDIETTVTDTNNVPQVDAALKKMKPLDEWSNKAIRNYLNRYAGTEKDPLKDVEIPVGTGTMRWGEFLDKQISSETGAQIQERISKSRSGKESAELLKQFGEVRPEEKVFNLGDEMKSPFSNASLQSYLSHVGDYLRQNVPAEKLQQYDLVRAVRETAENDKRVAKQMEKAQGDSTKSLPVHKAYSDGFKWVELKLPEKLTEEQAKSVERLTPKEAHKLAEKLGDADVFSELGDYAGEPLWIAKGPDGKPIKNSYTDQVAWAPSPEEAWLAGRLAEEGNQMGHCVGGYCQGVASGESKIFSLRDPKGKSHVTVEVEPNLDAKHLLADMKGKSQPIKDRFRPKGEMELIEDLEQGLGEMPGDWHFKHWLIENGDRVKQQFGLRPEDYKTEDSISQIKGKQNYAPNKEYLPYVQDFVKEGKWGEVRDLQNTGMVDVADRLHRGAASARSPLTNTQVKHLGEKLQGQKYLTEEEWQKAISEVPAAEGPRGQRGQISQDMVVGLSSLGLGGVVGYAISDDPSGALLTALAAGSLGLPGARARLKMVADAADYGLGSLSTRIGNLSEPVKLALRDYERRSLTASHDWLTKVVPFMKELRKVEKTTKGQELTRAILTNDKQRIADLMQGNQPLVAAWRVTQNVLHDLGEQLQGHGRFKTMLEDYFPRLVKDVEGLKAALGAPERTKLEAALIEGERVAMKNRGTPLTAVEQSSIINREIQGFHRAKGHQPGFAKQRGVDEITAKLQPFYHSPQESLFAYIRGGVQDLEMAKFFGKDLAQTRIGGQNHINVETSIGNLVGRELAEKRITPTEAAQLIKMLQSRFQGGERASSRLVQEVRNLGNLGLLGNVVSAATQLGDVATSIYAQGLRPTITAVVRQVTGTNKVSARDFGLADHIAEEFVSPTKTADWLQKAFKLSGFSAIDRFGKTTNLNAALSKVEQQSRSNEGISKLSVKYGEAFGSEFPRLVGDLQNGRLTERVRSVLFSELSDVQPISKAEMPQAYLDNPNGRLVYMLKTFMLKQMDMMRRDVVQEATKGNVGKAISNATSYALVLGLAGATTDMIKDWLLGRPVKWGATEVAENVLKTFGWSEYTRDKFAKKGPMTALGNIILPPWQMIDHIVRMDPKAVQYIPLVGKLYYSWELGGKEASEIAKKRGTGEPLSAEAEEYRRRKREKK